jgi:tRNA-intron endonuclease
MAKKEKEKTGIGIISGTKVIVGDPELKSFLVQKGFGEGDERGGERHELSFIEALFLLEKDNMKITDGKKYFKFEDMLKIGSHAEENFYATYKVYSDLRSRGLLVRTGFKFGMDFRVYDRGATLGSSHSTKLVHVVPEEYTCSFPELARATRLAEGVNKSMIFAIVDEEDDITYYQIGRVKI